MAGLEILKTLRSNSDHLLEKGAAIRCNNLPVLAYKIDRLLDDPERMARMRQCVQKLARPDAAKKIVNKLLELKASEAPQMVPN